ncbi:MAG TPA: CPBP family intramembrane glutamic endopeptidase [Pyrinomonadaceae bacterium]
MSASEAKRAATPTFVASKLHTAIVLLVLCVLAVGGILRTLRGSHNLVGPAGRLPLYTWILAIQLLLFWFVRTGMRQSGYSVGALIDPSPRSLARLVGYLGIAVAAWILWMIFGVALGSLLKPSPAELSAIQEFLPHGRLEKLCWVAFSAGSNFCEEVLYRGYLLRQFRALTGSSTAALFLQTVIFAMGHLALGVPITISVSLLALWLGALTLWQKSLLPSMIVHVSISLFGGLAFSP